MVVGDCKINCVKKGGICHAWIYLDMKQTRIKKYIKTALRKRAKQHYEGPQNSITKDSKTALRRTAKQRYEGEHIFHISTMSTHPTFPW